MSGLQLNATNAFTLAHTANNGSATLDAEVAAFDEGSGLLFVASRQAAPPRHGGVKPCAMVGRAGPCHAAAPGENIAMTQTGRDHG